MGLFFGSRDREPLDSASPDELLAEARNGDRAARDLLIRRYTPLVLRIASRLRGRYLQVGQDDEVSIGLMGFNEAIDGYDPARGVSFVAFAEVVVRRRLIDYLRREAKRPEVPLTVFDEEDEEGNTGNFAQTRQALDDHARQNEAWERRQEILRYQGLLSRYGISFAELVDISPKHGDARRRAIEAARIVASTPEYRQHLKQRKELPMKSLEERVQVSRKTLERQRKYIIAVALILMEDLVYLREYLDK